MPPRLYKICFYVPVADAETVKSAVFLTGAGAVDDYTECSFEVRGTGQFRPAEGANPTIGQANILETVEELKIELVCDAAHVIAAVEAMIAAHPYEQPAYQVWPVHTLESLRESLQ